MRYCRGLLLFVPVAILVAGAVSAPPKLVYQKKASREETILASLKASGLPFLEGKWHHLGPFDNSGKKGFAAVYPPEKEIDLAKTYKGKDNQDVAWKEFPGFKIAGMNNLARFNKNNDACVYLYHEIEVTEPVELPVALGSDDTLTVWLNGQKLLALEVYRPAAPDQNQTVLKLRPGKNALLIKVCNGGGFWELYLRPEFPPALAADLAKQLDKDFPKTKVKPAPTAKATPESNHYRIVNLPVPADCVMEVGGLAFRKDGKLLASTRRGEVWLISNPEAEQPEKITFKRFAFGLHEALGLLVDNSGIYCVQRPELTKLVPAQDDPDRVAEFVTVCDKWGVSGDYHEFAFGPVRDKEGNFYVTLNVGFGGGNPARAPWRGWCVKINPQGELFPFACGLRSPNGLNFNPDGDLFYCDNQGEWVATGKMHHIREGEWYGHPVGLRWAPQSPFASKLLQKFQSGMLYDGQKGMGASAGAVPFTRPCILFPYGRMGQSQSEPLWDTTAGKFGPFAGQCFVGDQTNANVMRVDLQKVNGRYQGACFPFRSGFECGVNRLVFGPDGSLYVGMTNRGWGSRGGKPYGLQRLVYTGVLPFEIYSMKLTQQGFDLTFTKPLDAASAGPLTAYNLVSFTYNYGGAYGAPEVDRKVEKLEAVTVSGDRKKVALRVNGLRQGRVYELRVDPLRAETGEPVLHPEAYYTLNDRL